MDVETQAGKGRRRKGVLLIWHSQGRACNRRSGRNGRSKHGLENNLGGGGGGGETSFYKRAETRFLCKHTLLSYATNVWFKGSFFMGTFGRFPSQNVRADLAPYELSIPSPLSFYCPVLKPRAGRGDRLPHNWTGMCSLRITGQVSRGDKS